MGGGGGGLTLTLKIHNAADVETSVTVNNSVIHNYTHRDDHIPPTCEMTYGFKPFTDKIKLLLLLVVVLFFYHCYFILKLWCGHGI